MKFISSTVVAALATTMAMASSVLASDLPASGGKSRKLAKAEGPPCGDSPYQRVAIIAGILMRQWYASAPLLKPGLDGLPGSGPLDLNFLRTIYGNDAVDSILLYEATDGNNDGEVSSVEWVQYFVNVFYDADDCINELISIRDELPEVPKEVVIPLLAPAPAPARV